LVDDRNIKVFLTGGLVRQNIYSTVGPFAEKFIRSFNADKLFLSADAVDIHSNITDANTEESSVKKSMLRAAKEIILVADSSKFNRVSFSNVSDFSILNAVITDNKIPGNYVELFKRIGIKLYLV